MHLQEKEASRLICKEYVNESIRPVWSSNWTVNINTEMNYWMNGSCNLLDSYLPFVEFVSELSDAKKQPENNTTAPVTANHNVDIWRQTGPVAGEPKYAYWPMRRILVMCAEL